MDTKLVIPLIVATNDIDAKLTLYHDGSFNNCELSTNLDRLQYHTNQQLVLISFDPNDKIERNDLYYHTKYRTIHKAESFDTTQYDGDWCKKVIATQDQLSPELISQLENEYNNGGMKNFEIEMSSTYFNNTPLNHGQPDYDWCNTPDDLAGFKLQPKLTKSFVTVINKPQIQPSSN